MLRRFLSEHCKIHFEKLLLNFQVADIGLSK